MSQYQHSTAHYFSTSGNKNNEQLSVDIETKFVNEQGNTIVETNDGSDEVYVIKNSNQEDFKAELMKNIKSDLHISKSENDVLGEKYGFNLKNIYKIYGLSGFEGNADFNMGYMCGYHNNPGACGGTWTSMGEGKGGGAASFGNEIGKKHKKLGLIPLLGKQLKNNSPIYSIFISPIFSKSDQVVGYRKQLRLNN